MSTTTRSVLRRVVLAATTATTTAALVAGTVAVAGAASAAPTPTATGRVVTASASATQQRAAVAYWTTARLQAARDLDVMTAPATAAGKTTAAEPRPTGPRGQADGTAPTRATTNPDTASPAKAAGTATYLPIAKSAYATFPYRQNGKVFFTTPQGGAQCSGTSVTAFYNGKQQSEVWTAGHCIANGGGQNPGVWHSQVVFIPAYNGTSSDPKVQAPFGVFPLSWASTSWNWLTKGDASVDLGAFQVGTSTTGLVLHQAVGAAGFRWNWSPNQTVDAFGYPANSPYDGTSMYHYRAATTEARVNWGGQGQPMVGMANPMTGGSSGGQWSAGWSTTSSGWINGHNDWKFADQSIMYSPYFDDLANTVRCFGLTNC